MIELDGIEYSVEDATTNAGTMIEAINEYAATHNVRNSKGELIQFTVNWANPFYMILYGVGVLFNYVQNMVYSAACGVSLANSSARQLLNLADIANVRRKSATTTTIVGTVYSDLTGDTCSITTSLTCTVATSAGSVVFHPAFDVDILPGQAQKIVLVTDTAGSFSIAANTITSFDTNPENFRSMTTLASIPGQREETIQSLRKRLQARATSGTLVDKAEDAISALPGVSNCSIYYNKSISENTIVGGITVPPRQALIFVQGFSNDIAKTFFSYMLCDVAGSESGNAIAQTYTQHNGQELTAYIITPDQTPIYIRIYAADTLSDSMKQSIRDTVMTLCQSLTIGQSVSSGEIITLLQATYNTLTFVGCQVSLDNSSFQYKVTPSPYQIITFNSNNILVSGDS